MAQTLIDFYRAIENASQHMLEAAKAGNWDEVAKMEGACAVLIEQLRFQSRSEELLPEHRKEKIGIMHRILGNDAQVRLLAEPWMARLEKKFDGLQQILH